ncbi:DUF58 domain-containing protein [bacterium]|nr:DUF58 domain-containing protein [bacterium]
MTFAGDYRKYLEPETVSRLSRLDLIARLVVEGFITGLHRSPYHGFSVEFSEYRPYMPGDPTRLIDWKVYGRSDRYYVKRFEEETNLKAYLLVDASGSMGYASGKTTKLQYAVYLAAALSYLMLTQRDAVGLATFDSQIRRFLPPRSVLSYLSVLLKELDNLSGAGDTNLSETCHSLAERIKRRGLIILFSDLFDDPDRLLGALKHFRHKKHEVIVFHVLDPMEIRFDFKGDTLFIDLESGTSVQTEPWQVREGYRNLMQAFMDRYRRECLRNRIDYVPVSTDQPFSNVLFRYLSKRSRLGG